jgi:pimeloyl-ACP methyl ester carboxylesterase
VERLQLAAETHGVILVASNNSRNGSWSESFKAAQAIFDDTWSRFSIDTSQVYSCGFSGGARVATALAVNSGRIAGVIACGAGFPTVAEYQPRADMKFVWIGVVGNRDMNYLEVHKIHEKLSGWKGHSHVIEFDGRHQWPSADTMLLAMDLLQLEMMRTGKGSAKGVGRLRKRAADYAAQGRGYEAGTFLLGLTEAFPDQFGAEDRKQAESWLAEKESIRKARTQEKTFRDEEELQRKYSEQFILDLSQPDDSAAARFWKEEADLLHKLQRSKSPDKARMADRLINQLWVRCYEMGQHARESDNDRSLATYCLIWSCVQPQSIYANYLAARAFAKLDKKKFALDYLQKAIDCGMKDPEKLEEEDFSSIRETRTFVKLKEKLAADNSDKIK